ncbi:hypothetical protein HHK36_000950 [Tetracentron sinense]|uniref:Bifunctional inhibitor/plant lipid transfer protein/seed storage helical domain-containing protein n=1 Tax=Tetracentron sinense TaxID=13715 RepID=A0A835DQI0_TETSI|nr:hypothetical protein HHK36_000950 [Tetracentron sinense]
MAPCAMAAQDEHAQVSGKCCSEVKRIGQNQNLSCLCADMLSQTVKIAGINPAVAMTIPKRCNIVNRPVGYKIHIFSFDLQDWLQQPNDILTEERLPSPSLSSSLSSSSHIHFQLVPTAG